MNGFGYEQLIELLRTNSDAQFDAFNSSIVGGNVPTIGCRIPFLRSVAQSGKISLDEVMSFPVNQYHEVDLMRGIMVSSASLPFPAKTDYILRFADTIATWAVCDSSTIKVKSKEKDVYFEFFLNMLTSDRVFVVRYGVVNLLANYLCKDYVDRVFEGISSINLYGEYYVDMSVAWLIASAMVNCREKTIIFLQTTAKTVLNVFTYNKALQKMRDSRRISNEDKLWTYSQTR